MTESTERREKAGPTTRFEVRARSNTVVTRERLAAALRQAVAFSRSPAKELAQRLGLSQRGAELLLRGDCAPSLGTLIEACRQFDEVWLEVQALCGRAEERSEAQILLDDFARMLAEWRRPPVTAPRR